MQFIDGHVLDLSARTLDLASLLVLALSKQVRVERINNQDSTSGYQLIGTDENLWPSHFVYVAAHWCEETIDVAKSLIEVLHRHFKNLIAHHLLWYPWSSAWRVGFVWIVVTLVVWVVPTLIWTLRWLVSLDCGVPTQFHIWVEERAALGLRMELQRILVIIWFQSRGWEFLAHRLIYFWFCRRVKRTIH